MGRGLGSATSGLAVALTAFGCAHKPAAQAPAKEGSDGIVVSAEFVKGASTNAIAAWIGYGATRKVLFEAAETAPGARAKSTDDYTLEMLSRGSLIRQWRDYRKDEATPPDAYLDTQVAVEDAGFLEEYAVAYLSQPGWTVPGASFANLDWPAYRAWADQHLRGHEGERFATFVPRTRDPEPPGSALPSAQDLLPTVRPCAETRATLAAAVAAWSNEEKGLHGAPLVAESRQEFARSLEWAAGRPEVRSRGVTWVLPVVSDLHFLAGFCANDRQDWKEAVRLLGRTVALRPLVASLRGELVHALSQLRRFDEADREIDAALALGPGRCTQARLLRARGYIQIERRMVVEAYRTYARSLELDPTSEVARNELKLIVGLLQAAGSADAKVLSEVPIKGVSTTTTGTCRDE